MKTAAQFNPKIQEFAQLVEKEQTEQYIKAYPRSAETQALVDSACRTKVIPGPKYTKVDVGTSGKYMIVNETGEIFGIKGYGVIHRGHFFGTLDTIHEWNWSGYRAFKKLEVERGQQ